MTFYHTSYNSEGICTSSGTRKQGRKKELGESFWGRSWRQWRRRLAWKRSPTPPTPPQLPHRAPLVPQRARCGILQLGRNLEDCLLLIRAPRISRQTDLQTSSEAVILWFCEFDWMRRMSLVGVLKSAAEEWPLQRRGEVWCWFACVGRLSLSPASRPSDLSSQAPWFHLPI